MKLTGHLAAAAILAGGFTAPAVAADYVVLDSDAAGIEIGLVARGGAHINIPEGATVVLIDPAGETRVVPGPFSGPISQAAANGANDAGVFERLTTQRGADTTVLGASRAPKFEGGALKE